MLPLLILTPQWSRVNFTWGAGEFSGSEPSSGTAGRYGERWPENGDFTDKVLVGVGCCSILRKSCGMPPRRFPSGGGFAARGWSAVAAPIALNTRRKSTLRGARPSLGELTIRAAGIR